MENDNQFILLCEEKKNEGREGRETCMCAHMCASVCVLKSGVWGRKEGIDQRRYPATLKPSTIQLLKELRRNAKMTKSWHSDSENFPISAQLYCLNRKANEHTHTHITLLIPFASPWRILCKQKSTEVPVTAFFKDLS